MSFSCKNTGSKRWRDLSWKWWSQDSNPNFWSLKPKLFKSLCQTQIYSKLGTAQHKEYMEELTELPPAISHDSVGITSGPVFWAVYASSHVYMGKTVTSATAKIKLIKSHHSHLLTKIYNPHSAREPRTQKPRWTRKGREI